MPILPTTQLGRRGLAVTAVGLAAWIAFLIANDALDGLGSPWRLLALAGSQLLLLGGGAACVIAVACRGERALLVLVALVPVALMALLIVAEVSGLIE